MQNSDDFSSQAGTESLWSFGLDVTQQVNRAALVLRLREHLPHRFPEAGVTVADDQAESVFSGAKPLLEVDHG